MCWARRKIATNNQVGRDGVRAQSTSRRLAQTLAVFRSLLRTFDFRSGTRVPQKPFDLKTTTTARPHRGTTQSIDAHGKRSHVAEEDAIRALADASGCAPVSCARQGPLLQARRCMGRMTSEPLTVPTAPVKVFGHGGAWPLARTRTRHRNAASRQRPARKDDPGQSPSANKRAPRDFKNSSTEALAISASCACVKIDRSTGLCVC